MLRVLGTNLIRAPGRPYFGGGVRKLPVIYKPYIHIQLGGLRILPFYHRGKAGTLGMEGPGPLFNPPVEAL